MKTLSLGENLKQIGVRAFSGCSSLIEVVIPDYVTTIANSYGTSETFSGCKALKKITLGKRINSMGSRMFSDCPNVAEITIKAGCSVIGNECFYGSTNISIIKNYCEEIPTTGDKVFSNYNATLYVPESAIEDYKATAPWSNFLDIKDVAQAPSGGDNKVSTPTIIYENGVVSFSCETEDVEYVASVKCADAGEYECSSFPLTKTYTITVYAKKEGYDNSDVAKKEINVGDADGLRGDVNKDGEVNVGDLVVISNIMSGNE